jgi:PAS domain S-box-containing protein
MLLIASAALVGWFSGSVALRGIKPTYVPMAPNTALVFIALGALLATFARNSRGFLIAARVAAILPIILVGARFSEYLFGIDLKADRWIFNFPAERLGLAPVGKMAFFTSATFLLFSSALLLITWPNHRWTNSVAKVLAVIVAFMGSAFSLGYVYGAPLLYGGQSIPMALNTALAFVIGGLGLLAQAVVFDINTRRRSEAALRESEERYRLLFENNPHPIWVYDLESLAFLAVNEAAVRRYGYGREEFLAMTLKDIRPAEEIPSLLENVGKTVSGFQASVWKHRKKNGGIIDVEITSYPLLFGGRQAKVVLANDITERKRAQDAIAALNVSLQTRGAELEQANKELESFSYSVSHDLRAPLRAIDGFSRILAEEHAGNLDADAQRLLGIVRSNTQNMGRLIDDLLAFSRLGRKQIERSRIDMKTLAHDVFTEVSPVHSNPTPAFHLTALPVAYGDPALIRQVVLNLVSNAVKYSRTRDNPTIQINAYAENGEQVYLVKDNGVGFDMKYQDKLFGVFQRLHSAEEFEGTGVGLAIVQRIINRHGGRVWAESKVNEGATFYFTLPGEYPNNGSLNKHE